MNTDSRLTEFPLALRTELMFAQFDGLVTRYDGFTVVRTPANPSFYWGNFLIIHGALLLDDLPKWLAVFSKHIHVHYPESDHIAIALVHAPDAACLALLKTQGFETEQSIALELTQSLQCVPPHVNPAFEVRLLDLRTDADAVIELQMLDLDGFEPTSYRHYLQDKFKRYLAMQLAGRGGWFGVFNQLQQLVGVCGLYFSADQTFGRFQNVMTHPDFRGQGVCSTLIDAACSYAFTQWRVQRLVMQAVPEELDGPAVRVYRACGFVQTQGYFSLQRRATRDRAPAAQ